MTSLLGNQAARAAFEAALDSGKLHHGWLIAGPEGVGKGTFAREAAARILTRASSMTQVPALLAAGSHPDYRELVRLPRDPEKPDQGLARSISIDQVRSLQPMLATRPSLSDRRVIIIDSIDDLERPAANALLKNLEEPPAGTIFLLVSHAPGRLLPTIRSRCRVLRFEPLADADVAAVVRQEAPDLDEREVNALVAVAAGSPGRALAFAGLDMAAIERDLIEIANTGDPSRQVRLRLARAVTGKSAQPRFEALLARIPSFVAERARERSGEALRSALDGYAEARALAASAIPLSLEPAVTTIELAGLVARLAPASGLQPSGTMH